MVGDLERSLKFYVDGLGMKVGTRLPGNPGPGATMTSGNGQVPFLLIRQAAATASDKPDIQAGNGLSRIMLVVPDSAAAAARLRTAGYAHTAVNGHLIPTCAVRDSRGIPKAVKI